MNTDAYKQSHSGYKRMQVLLDVCMYYRRLDESKNKGTNMIGIEAWTMQKNKYKN
mgnify:CR=1 FL=1